MCSTKFNKTKVFFKCSDELKKRFANSSCLLTISVGQESHEGDFFAATIDKVNQSFAACTIIIDDSLQRYNMALNSTKDADAFYEIAIAEGDFWLKRNEKYLNRVTIPLKVFRWDKWLNHSGFNAQLNKVKNAIKHDQSYKEVFDKSVEEFLKKYHSRLVNPENIDWQRARKLSYDFITEECAALCLWPELQCDFEIYPIKHNDAINATRDRFIKPHYPDLLQAVNIGFRNAKQMRPQRFVLA